jgi:hypothetical protein
VHRGRGSAFGRKRTRFDQRNDAGGAFARIVTALGRETRLELLHAGERRDLQLLRLLFMTFQQKKGPFSDDAS